MSLVIANNVKSVTAQMNLKRTSRMLGKSLERLSSGLKINRGADGPAALVISEKQRAQIAGLRQAIDNADKAVSLVQTAEGALNEINSLLVKVRSLAIDSANTGVNDDESLAANQAEIANALDTINRVANNTQFGKKKLLDGSAGIQGVAQNTNVQFLRATSDTSSGSFNVNISAAGTRANYTAGAAQTSNLANDETLTINGVNIDLNAGMSQAQVVSRINEFSGETGVVAETFDHDANAGTPDRTRLRTQQFGQNASLSVVSNQASAADSTGFGTTAQNVSGTDIAGTIGGVAATGVGNVLTATSGAASGLSVSIGEDTANLAATVSGDLDDITVSNNSLTFQIGPNQNQTVQVTIDQMNPSSLGLGVANNQFTNLADIDVTSAGKAQDSVGIIDQAIEDVTTLRGSLGAFQQNTLESTANNLQATLENSINAESVIRDTDFAEEIANFTKQQVLMQAGTSVLSNANQQSQLVLSLLG